MDRAILYALNYRIWLIGISAFAIWVLFYPGSYEISVAYLLRLMWIRYRGILEYFKLGQRHLYEQIELRQSGLKSGIIIRETTVELSYKVILYLLFRGINVLLQK
jgi:hypothetical protein